MAELVNQVGVAAKDLTALVRIEGDDASATKLAYLTDTSTSESRSYDTTATKDGSVKTAGAYEGTHSLTAHMATGEGGDYARRIREECVRASQPKRLEVWVVDRTGIDEETLTIGGDYSLDYVTTFNTSAGSEGSVELSIETEIDNTPKYGQVTVTPELLELFKTIVEEQEFVQPTQEV